MTKNMTHMMAEVREIPEAARRLLDGNDAIAAAAEALRVQNPHFLATIARGSSDHAASFLKYAVELTTGIPVASLAPSVASIYETKMRMAQGASIAISQSGESPDILAMSRAAREGGATTIAFTNNPKSPLAQTAAHAIDIAAGPELSVAATKTFTNSIVAGLCLLAEWQEDEALRSALKALPEKLDEALQCDWSQMTETFDRESSLYVLGRGPSMAIASEVALKFKETCGVHAEAYSAAEVMHGPVALVENGFPVLTLAARDKAESVCLTAAENLADSGADAFVTAAGAKKARKLDFVATGHPLTDALCLVVPFYKFVESYARHLGLNPDQPPRLRKVTETR